MNSFQTEVLELRKQIDEIDDAIAALLGQRFEVTRRIGRVKQKFDVPAVDLDREEQVFARRRNLARVHHVPLHTMDAVYRLIVTEVVSEHLKLTRN